MATSTVSLLLGLEHLSVQVETAAPVVSDGGTTTEFRISSEEC